ncbi:hypothetical protein JVU11DRAFT_2043 [Chiua virens]|nr:hypothetical protein JVU11DRAFT_2043 [Chiua virens]
MALVSSPSQSFLQMESHETFTYTYDLDVGNMHLQILILIRRRSTKSLHIFAVHESRPCRTHHRATRHHETLHSPPQIRFCRVRVPTTIEPPNRLSLLFSRLASAPRASIIACLVPKTSGSEMTPTFERSPTPPLPISETATQDMSIYQGRVGRAHVSFILRSRSLLRFPPSPLTSPCRWRRVEPEIYTLSLDYEAGGAGRPLFEDYHLRLSCEPQTLSFLIYTIPVPSTPTGASHRLRVWIRTPAPPQLVNGSSSVGPSYLYQRLWKSDDFKIGAQLNFESVGSKIILATRSHASEAVDSSAVLGESTLTPNRRRRSRLAPSVGVDDAGDSVVDR